MRATIYTIQDAAELLSLHEETLRRAYRDGRLKAALIGRRLRVSETELERYWLDNGGGQLWDEQKKKTKLPEKVSKKVAKVKTKKPGKKITAKKAET